MKNELLAASVVFAIDIYSVAECIFSRRANALSPVSIIEPGHAHDRASRPLPQRTIGILGGMSNQATGEYYRMLNKRLNARLGGWDNGEIVIVSVNFGNIEFFVRQDQWDEAHSYLAGKVDCLERAGADVIVRVSNTMHRVVEPIMAERSTPFHPYCRFDGSRDSESRPSHGLASRYHAGDAF